MSNGVYGKIAVKKLQQFDTHHLNLHRGKGEDLLMRTVS